MKNKKGLLVLVAVVFVSCPEEPGTAEITYDNRSDFVVSNMSGDTADDSSSTLAPGKVVTFPYVLPPYADSVGLDFYYTLNTLDGKKDFYCPDKETGKPRIRIYRDERKTVVIYNKYYEIR